MALRNVSMSMVGMVLDVRVKPGDAVRKKQIIMVLEAMKMKIPVFSPVAGVVKTVNALEGQVLERCHVLAVIEEDAGV